MLEYSAGIIGVTCSIICSFTLQLELETIPGLHALWVVNTTDNVVTPACCNSYCI